MVRLMTAADLDAVADIWLGANLDTHDFIPAEYWRAKLGEVRAAIAGAEAYVYESPEGVEGFIGLDGERVAGLFVRSGARSRGVGHALMEAAKERRDFLELRVYTENWPAVKFYYREGFTLANQYVDAETGADEYEMVWWA